jgi:molybdate transport system ATP-binding protein
MTAARAPHLDVDIRLSVHDATRRFNLDVRFASQAPVVALYGPSGAGKSMTLQALAGLLRPAQGHIRLGERTLFDAAAGIHLPPQQRGLGYLFQHYALFPHLTVRQNIGFGLTTWWRRRPDRAAAARIDELIESLGLQSLAQARPHTLSGGQQQRVALARALACEPELLLLDEPFAALNPMLRDQLRQDLVALQRQWQIPIVMITHDIDDVLALADVAYVVEGGQVVREIDVHQASSRELASRAVRGVAADAEPARRHPHEQAIRQLLHPSQP